MPSPHENLIAGNLSQSDLDKLIAEREAGALTLESFGENQTASIIQFFRAATERRLFVDDYNSGRTLIGNLDLLGNEQIVRIQGLVSRIRNQKNTYFIDLQDHTGTAQCVIWKPDANENLTGVMDTLTRGSAITVSGILKKGSAARAKSGLEIGVQSIQVDGPARQDYPIQPGSSLEHRMDYRHISLRNPEDRLIFQIQTALEESLRAFWSERGFIELHSPKLMGSQSESGAELFKLDYFGTTAFLAQSPQFYKQMAIASGFPKVFEVGPVFRANPSFTSRHDTEFTSLDVELSWVESHEDVMKVEEQMLHRLLIDLQERFGEAIEQTFGEKITIPTVPFPRIPLEEARKIVQERYGHKMGDVEDLDPEGERLIAQYIRETFGHEFVFITDYPISVRPFYHMRYPDRPHVTRSFDLLWNGLEITTGAQREHRAEVLERQIREKGLGDQAGIQKYLGFFEHGCPPHGGFGLGLTRMLMILLGKKNVREVTYLYRGPNRLTP